MANRVTQVVGEVVLTHVGDMRVSSLALEVLGYGPTSMRCSSLAIEILVGVLPGTRTVDTDCVLFGRSLFVAGAACIAQDRVRTLTTAARLAYAYSRTVNSGAYVAYIFELLVGGSASLTGEPKQLVESAGVLSQADRLKALTAAAVLGNVYTRTVGATSILVGTRNRSVVTAAVLNTAVWARTSVVYGAACLGRAASKTVTTSGELGPEIISLTRTVGTTAHLVSTDRWRVVASTAVLERTQLPAPATINRFAARRS